MSFEEDLRLEALHAVREALECLESIHGTTIDIEAKQNLAKVEFWLTYQLQQAGRI